MIDNSGCGGCFAVMVLGAGLLALVMALLH